MVKRKQTIPLYEDIRALVLSARQTVARGVDLLQVVTNYEIGRRIVEQEQRGSDRAEYGTDLLNDLSSRLAGEFGNGFSVSNLKYMRQFYLAYPDRVVSIRQTLSGELQGREFARHCLANLHPLQSAAAHHGNSTIPEEVSTRRFLLAGHIMFFCWA